jgi:hypothetical protein
MAKKIAIKIYYNERDGEVEGVGFTKRFDEEGVLFQLDVLGDAIEGLKKIYNYKKGKFFSNLNDIGEA